MKKPEDVTDFPTPSAPTSEMIDARREAQEEAAQAAIDWKRYQTDQAYRDRMDEQQRREAEAERESYQRARNRDGAGTMNYGCARGAEIPLGGIEPHAHLLEQPLDTQRLYKITGYVICLTC